MSNLLDYEINKELGECYLFMGEYEKSKEYYEKAAQNTTEFSAPQMGLATIAVQVGDLDTAIFHYQKALEIEKVDNAFTGLGLIATSRGLHAEAFDYFKNALDLNATNTVALGGLVQEGYALKRVADVVAYVKKFYEETKDPQIKITLAGCLINLDKKEEAKMLLEEALAELPDNQDAKDLYAFIAA
ncbi:tetratricopeptide repeat protein [Peptacetobacter sp.]|uniref:tetratricopeptide repeat protein n=1 Tax=Peptacetobacter sp. TaxID=2991975 RepID=UPI0026107DF4|nr:tetratricopeptide repeat protein [Peptacetobacter sp.]